MKTLCVILARAGSKGLPGKNTALAGGQPLVAWTIEHAQDANGIDRIVLSTDGQAIAQIGKDRGVHVIPRPEHLATDAATVDGAARHAVESVERTDGGTYAVVVILYGNVPVRPPGLIDLALQKLEMSGADSVQSVCSVGKFHPYWMVTVDSEAGDVLEPYQPNAVYRRQDLPPVYQLDGGVMVVTRQSLFTVDPRQPHAFLGRDRRVVTTEPGQIVDVDTSQDLLVAQVALQADPPVGGFRRGR